MRKTPRGTQKTYIVDRGVLIRRSFPDVRHFPIGVVDALGVGSEEGLSCYTQAGVRQLSNSLLLFAESSGCEVVNVVNMSS